MKNYRFPSWLLVLVLMSAIASPLPAVEKKFNFPALRDIKPRQMAEAKLKNGIRLCYLPDRELPLVKIQVWVKTGSAFDPPGRTGLADFAAQLMLTGGIPGKTGDEFDEFLERRGARIDVATGKTSFIVSASCLAADVPDVLQMVHDLLSQPSLEPDKLDLLKLQQRSAISRRNDNPADQADEAFSRLVYGEQSPYARQIEYADVEAITRDDIRDWIRLHIQPNRLLIGVWGDFDQAGMHQHLAELFGSWSGSGQPAPVFPAVTAKPAAGCRLIDRKDVNQASLRLGHLGVTMDNPDFPAIQIMNSILGSSSFMSRMMQKIRTDEGLTYGVSAAVKAEMAFPGEFRTTMATKSESAVRAIELILGEIARIRDTPVTGAELAAAKEAYLNSFVFNYESSQDFLSEYLKLAYYGYPADFQDAFRRRISQVTEADVQRVAREYLHPDQLTILIVGNRELIEKAAPLSRIGSFEVLDVSIPPPPAAEDRVPEPTPAALAKGKLLLGALVEKMKLADVLPDLAGYHLVQEGKLIPSPGMEVPATVETYTFWPGASHLSIANPMFSLKQVFDGRQGWVSSPQGVKDFSPEEAEDARLNIGHAPLIFLKKSLVEGFSAIFEGPAEIQGQQLDAVYLQEKGEKGFRIYLDPQTGLLRALAYLGTRMKQPGRFLQVFGAYAELGGILYPASNETYFNDQKFISTATKSLELNPPRDEKLFEKPKR